VGQAKQKRESDARTPSRTVSVERIERLTLLNLAYNAPTQGDAEARADLIDELIAGETEWDIEQRAISVERDKFHESIRMQLTPATLRYVPKFCDALDASQKISGGDMRYVLAFKRRAIAALSASANGAEAEVSP
jgi:hypothetical protein